MFVFFSPIITIEVGVRVADFVYLASRGGFLFLFYYFFLNSELEQNVRTGIFARITTTNGVLKSTHET